MFNNDPGTPAGAAPAWSPDFRLLESAPAAPAPPDWLAEGLLLHGRLTVVGAPPKSLGTGVAVDLAVSVAGGVPFLGAFATSGPAPAAYFCGPGQAGDVRDTARRVAAARDLGDRPLALLVHEGLPRLDRDADLAALRDALVGSRARVAVFDPLDQLMDSDRPGFHPLCTFSTAPPLGRLAATCLAASCTPVLVGHVKKGHACPGAEPLAPADLANAGVSESVAQWLLVRPRPESDPAAGRHRLLLSAGSRAGISLVRCLDVDEGTGVGRRSWEVAVREVTSRKGRTRGREACPAPGNLS